MKPIKFAGEIVGGKLIIHNRELLNIEVAKCADMRIVGTITKMERKRTNDQNGFYWGNFVPSQIAAFEEYWGETYRKEQMHEWNKTHFWGTEKVIEATGEVIMIPESSTKQSTVQWEMKLDKIRQWFRQNFEWEIPYPEEQSKLEI